MHAANIIYQRSKVKHQQQKKNSYKVEVIMIQKHLSLPFCFLSVLLITATVQPSTSQTIRYPDRDCQMKDEYFRSYDSNVSQGFKGVDALAAVRNYITNSDVS